MWCSLAQGELLCIVTDLEYCDRHDVIVGMRQGTGKLGYHDKKVPLCIHTLGARGPVHEDMRLVAWYPFAVCVHMMENCTGRHK